ncbi:hypothetical protein GCM10009710_14400 [Aeromicrobium alkaliterrae]|uniref:Nuclease SbcCD subunit C n=2 Tax=Aeromicrobium alkaliterrae TaxID=302168 RepID=A0ABP4VW57_9ACTN
MAEQLRQAEHEHVTLSEAALEANRAVVALRRRQLEGWSAEVAAQLEPGAACPVCGSTEHPAPAEARDDHVGEADLESAHHAHERSRDAESGAGRKVEALRASRDAARAAADGSVDGLTVEVASAEAELAEAAQALTARQALTAEASTLREQLAALEASLGTADERRHEATAVASAHETSLTSATTLVTRARGDAESVQERQAHLRTQLATARRLITATEAVQHRTEVAHAAAEALEVALGEHGFASAAEASAAVVAPAEVARLEALVGAHEQALAVVTATLAEPELADLPDVPVDPTPLHEARALASTVAAESADVRATAAKSLSSCEALVADISAALRASAEQLARYDTVRELDLALRGYGANQLRMPLETFALVAELEDILGAANVRLATMTHGRYQLLHSDDAGSRGTSGLELTVLDAHTGDSRSPSSLSGGEKFQASLALALGLAEVVTSRAGGLRLDTLFIDEGFGSLDAETLETTMETLDSLREGGRTIGLISHVEAMRESIPAQVQIDVTDGGWSTIRSTG